MSLEAMDDHTKQESSEPEMMAKTETDLQHSDQLFQEAVALNEAGMAAFGQYESNGRISDLNQAIACWHRALDLTPSDGINRSIFLSNLGTGLRQQYARDGKLANLEGAIAAHQQALEITSPDVPDYLGYLSNLGNVLRDRYIRTRDLADLEVAIARFKEAVQMIPAESPHRPGYLSNLGNGLSTRYIHSGDLTDLTDAITVYRQAVQITPSESPHRSGFLSNLGSVLSIRYNETGDLADLEAAIAAFEQAVQTAPSGSLHRSGFLSNLGNGLRNLYIRTGNLARLKAAIAAYQQAIQTTPPDASYQSVYMSNLSGGLYDRYNETGDLTDLETALTMFKQAVQATPAGAADSPALQSNLGCGLMTRYNRTGDLADLEAAIAAFEQAVITAPADAPDKPGYLNNLGAGLSTRYTHTGNMTDLTTAITRFEQAVQATLSNTPSRPIFLSNLGNGLRDRYHRTGDLADLEAAISAFAQAANATPSVTPDKARHLGNLGNGLQDRYNHTGNLTDLEDALTKLQEAVRITPSASPHRARYLGNLGNGLQDRYNRTHKLTDLEAAITAWESSWSVPYPRFAAFPVSYQLGQQRQGAGIAASLVVGYLERAQRRLFRAPGALRRALEVVEGSKSRLLTQLVGRGPLLPPEGLAPEVAAQERELLGRLTALDAQELASRNHFTTSQDRTSGLQYLQLRQKILLELEDIWTYIARSDQAGSAYVTLRRGTALTWQELTQLTTSLGSATALLAFFTTTDRALLFLLRAGWNIPHVAEVPLQQHGWADLLDNLTRETHSYDPDLNDTWDRPLAPLLTGIQHDLRGVERLILAPEGPGHLLPWAVLIERAGLRTPAGQPLSLVTLPALSVLPRLRRHQHALTGPAFVVGDPHGNLPYAEDEARAVAKRFGTEPLLGAAITRSAVLACFPHASLIHLATHAHFDVDNPLESGIEVADGVLTAREILQHRLHADLLVLSACESGQVGSLGGEELAGLSQAFLQAGVRSLLVSLWKVNDPATAALMQAFYTAWQEKGFDKASALRQAMTQIQQDPQHPHWSDPYYWGAFVFMGDWT